MLKVLLVVGTRPELIKSLALQSAAASFDPEVDLTMVHTGQNYDRSMAQDIAEELEIEIDQWCTQFSRSSRGQTAACLTDFTLAAIDRYLPDVVMNIGDTDTVMYSSLAAQRGEARLAHIEAGIRSSAWRNAEDINRRMSDHLADWNYVISRQDQENLLHEGRPLESCLHVGDITLDSLLITMARHGIEPNRGDYNLVTIHRQENANNPERLQSILEEISDAGVRSVFPVHPRTRDTLRRAGMENPGDDFPLIDFIPPQSYLPMVRLLADANKVLSDSGGLRREAYMLRKPVISLVDFVWFSELSDLGYERRPGSTKGALTDAIESFEPPGEWPPIFGDGRAGHEIFSHLIEECAQ